MKIGHSGQDFELNLAPIIDCFTVLIAFMLATASFLSIGILDAGIAAGGVEQKSTEAPPPVTVTVTLLKDHGLRLEVTGKESRKLEIAAREQESDWTSLVAQLTELKGRWKELQGATLVAENSVEYRDVVRALEQVRKVLPAVILGGF